MRKRKYDVTVEAEFVIEAVSPDEVKQRLRRLLRDSEFDETNFEFGISLHKEKIGRPVLEQEGEGEFVKEAQPVAKKMLVKERRKK